MAEHENGPGVGAPRPDVSPAQGLITASVADRSDAPIARRIGTASAAARAEHARRWVVGNVRTLESQAVEDALAEWDAGDDLVLAEALSALRAAWAASDREDDFMSPEMDALWAATDEALVRVIIALYTAPDRLGQ